MPRPYQPGMLSPLIWIVIGLVVALVLAARLPLQPARHAAEPRRQRLGADRGAAEAALRPDPEPRRDGEGLRGARARDVRGGHERTDARRRRRRARPSRRRRRGSWARRSAGCSRSPRTIRSCRRTRTSASSRTSWRQTENRIAVSRQVYNDTVLTYNNAIQTVPGVLVRGPVRLHEARVLRGRGSSRRRHHASRSSGRPPLAAAALALAGASRHAQSFALPRPTSRSQVQPDGSLVVDENITFALPRQLQRRLPRDPAPRRASRSTTSRVLRGRARATGRAPRPSSALRRPRHVRHDAAPTTGVRIVWHYQASSEERTFRVHYRLRGLAVAYDDVVDVNLKVWGDEWEQRLGRLTATQTAPGHRRAGLGPPGRACAATSRSTATAVAAPGDRRPGGAVRRAANADPAVRLHLDGRDAGAFGERRSSRSLAEEQEDAAAYERDRERLDDALAQPVAAAARPARARLPAGARRRRARLVALRPRARERLRPRVRAGAADRHRAGARAAAALAGRRGRLARVHRDAVRPDPPRPLQGDARDDGAEDLGRPAHRAGRRPRARRWRTSRRRSRRSRQPVASVVDSLVQDGPERLSRFRDRIEDDRDGELQALHRLQVGRRRRRSSRGSAATGSCCSIPASSSSARSAAILLWQGIDRLETFAPALERRRC